MLTTDRKLWIEKSAWQYWQLIRVIFFNFKVVGYILVFFISTACLLYIAGFIFPIFKALSPPVAFLALFIFFFIGVIILPMGMISLVTNKHVYTIPDMRKKIFVIVCIFCVFFSIEMPFFFHRMNGVGFSPNFALSIFLLGALYFWLSSYLTHKSLFLFGFAPLIMGSLGVFCSKYLTALHPAVLLLACVFSWSFFYRWWISFRPARTGSKPVLVEFNPRSLQGLPFEKLIYFSSNGIKTAMGSLLLGYGDGRLNLVKRLLMIFCFALFFSMLVCGAFIDWKVTENAFVAVLIALAYSFLISGVDFFSQRLLMNIKRCWLPFSGSRTDFFLYLENYFFRGIGFLVLVHVGVVSIFILLNGKIGYLLYCLVSIAIFSIMLAVNFYISIYFYSKKIIIAGEINFQKMLVNSLFFIPPIVYLVCKYEKFNAFEIKDGVAITIVFLLGMLFTTIRRACIRQWQQADF